MKSTREKYINLGIVASFACVFLGMFMEITALVPVGFILLGALLIVFKRDVAAERFRIDKETKNEFLKKHLFASETVERNSVVVMIVGIGFLIVGLIAALAALAAL